jgi:hypothetical protein
VDTHIGANLFTVHFYNHFVNGVSGKRDNERFGATGPHDASLLNIIKATTDAAGKPLFVEEFGDYSPDLLTDPEGLFAQAVIARAQALAIPLIQLWVWEFYQVNPWTPFPRSLEPGLTDTLIAKMGQFNAAFGFPPPSPSSPDIVPPTAILVYPYEGSTLAASQRLHAVASDDHAVTKVEFFVDGTMLVNTDTVAPYDYTFDSSGLSIGPHTITVKAYDAAGNTSESTVNVLRR